MYRMLLRFLRTGVISPKKPGSVFWCRKSLFNLWIFKTQYSEATLLERKERGHSAALPHQLFSHTSAFPVCHKMRNCVLNFRVDLRGDMKGELHQWEHTLRIPSCSYFSFQPKASLPTLAMRLSYPHGDCSEPPRRRGQCLWATMVGKPC